MPNVPILMYHALSASSEEASDYVVSLQDFEAQVAALAAEGRQAVLPRDLFSSGASSAALPERPVVFTFDDALASVGALAYPVLRRYGFSAAVYVVADHVGGSNTWESGPAARREACLDRDTLLALRDAGWEIGSHGRTHRDLTRLESAALEDEVAGSKRALEAWAGPVDSFCYPYSAFDETVRQSVARAGYGSALAHRVPSRAVTEDPLRVKRVHVKGRESLARLRRKISPWYLAYRGLVRT